MFTVGDLRARRWPSGAAGLEPGAIAETARGALHEKAKLPFVSYAVVDGNLVTGQNPGSAKETAKKVAEFL